MKKKNTKTQDFQEIGEDIFVKDTFWLFLYKSGRTVTFLYEIGYFMGIYEKDSIGFEIVWQKNRCQESIYGCSRKSKNVRAYIYVTNILMHIPQKDR